MSDEQIETLRAWLCENEEDISQFFELEEADEELTRDDFFQYWFGGPDYKDEGYRFVAIAKDGSGGAFAVWLRPADNSESAPLVFFGSEGGRCVVAKSAADFPLILAHGPGEPPELSLEDGGDPDGKEALDRYREAVTQKFGDLPPYDQLRAGRDALETEFTAWIERCVQ